MTDPAGSLTLLEYNSMISDLLDRDELRDVWVTAETVDVSRRNHCYLELIQKDDLGRTVARARAAIWANQFYRLDAKFTHATGRPFGSGMKVMVKLSATYHPQYGLSLVITDINPEFTLGDKLRRRQEMIERLTREGIIDMNRELEIPTVVQRIAIISSPTAAGYGDFMHQLENNSSGLRFVTRCFNAPMQGDAAPGGIINALDAIAAEEDQWDAVVIIRGGGATDDLSCFEDYDLAANIAQFPLPVIIGIGHERDITLLDYVAAMRVKTPTAAAEWIIERADFMLATVTNLGIRIRTAVADSLQLAASRLDRRAAELPLVTRGVLLACDRHLEKIAMALPAEGKASVERETTNLQSAMRMLRLSMDNIINAERDRLRSQKQLVDAYSPSSVLRRGYSFTTCGSSLVTSSKELNPGDVITTHLASGKIKSVVK
ncbi:MAG: exodeoxyribonuclease VII large subunit [Muribaculaceae bacterium]|nr:exodeoxyribonuclease VII large subunit [Muribaculaceae bacterium]